MDKVSTEDISIPELIIDSTWDLCNIEGVPLADLTLPEIMSQLSGGELKSSTSQDFVIDNEYREPSQFSENEEESSSTGISSDDEPIRVPTRPPPKKKEEESLIDVDPDYIPTLPPELGPSEELKKLGKVTIVSKGIIVIEAIPNLNPLNQGSGIYFSDGRPLGRVYDTIGRVTSPLYVVVHENVQPAPSKKKAQQIAEGKIPAPSEIPKITGVEVKVGDEVFFVESQCIWVLVKELERLNPIDDDEGELFFSDDEKERQHQQKEMCKRSHDGQPRNAIARNHLSRGDKVLTRYVTDFSSDGATAAAAAASPASSTTSSYRSQRRGNRGRSTRYDNQRSTHFHSPTLPTSYTPSNSQTPQVDYYQMYQQNLFDGNAGSLANWNVGSINYHQPAYPPMMTGGFTSYQQPSGDSEPQRPQFEAFSQQQQMFLRQQEELLRQQRAQLQMLQQQLGRQDTALRFPPFGTGPPSPPHYDPSAPHQ